jgi:flagellar motor switch protein FliM
MSNKVQPYNFARPGRLPSDLEQRLRTWLKAAFALAARDWTKRLPFSFTMTVRELSAVPPADALEKIPDNAYGCRLNEPHLGVSLLALPRPLLLALLTGLLGNTAEALPPDRSLTPVEEALWEYFIRSLWFPVLQQTWPEGETFAPVLEQKEINPRFVRIFPASEPVVACVLGIQAPFGEHDWYWLLSQRALATNLVPTTVQPATAPIPARPPRECLESLVRDLTLEFSASLGSIELPLSQISQLRVGDVVVLDQRCGEPLTASVDGKQKFQGWPGRVGNRQAVMIHALLEG